MSCSDPATECSLVVVAQHIAYSCRESSLSPDASPRQRQANSRLVLSEIGTTAERPTHAARDQKGFAPALLRSASGRAFALLTKTYLGLSETDQLPERLAD